jgi:uncharacterized protein YjiK
VGLCLVLLAASDPSPLLPTFDLSKDGGEQVKLSRNLQEISGLALTPDGRLLAHHDERAVIFQLDPETGEVLQAFSAGFGGAPGDFEGIAVTEDRIFLSTSDGGLLQTSQGSPGATMDYRFHASELRGRCEFEGLAFDPHDETLLLPCKTPRDRELEDHVVVFSLELSSGRVLQVPRIFLPLEELEEVGLDDSFSPSGIEVHPETGRIFLVSARDEAILEFSPGGALLDGRELHKKTHPQTEGITFGRDGTLYLADEGQGKRGRLTRYRPGQGEEGNQR